MHGFCLISNSCCAQGHIFYQRLGLWLRYNQKSAISRGEWDSLQCTTLPGLRGKLYVGIKYGHDGTGIAMSIAAKTATGKIFVEAIDYRQVRDGNAWILKFLKDADIASVIVDGASGQQLLAAAMKDAKLRAPVLPTVKQIIVAGSTFEQTLFAKKLCHMGQPALTVTDCLCERWQIGRASCRERV